MQDPYTKYISGFSVNIRNACDETKVRMSTP